MSNSKMNTLLYVAIIGKNKDLVRTLMEQGARIDFSDKNGVTAWGMACDSELGGGNVELLEILLKYGTDINASDNDTTALDRAIRYNKDARIAEFLLRHGAIIDYNLGNKQPLLVDAAQDDNLEIVKLLLSYKANPNSKSEDGTTALIHASINKNFPMIKELVKNGADINIINKSGYSALMWSKDDFETLKFLLQNGADPDLDITPKMDNINLGKMGSALNNACSEDNLDKALLLLKHGANPNDQDDMSRISPLHWACDKGDFMLVKALIEHGANPKLTDFAGRTPALVALQKKHIDIYSYLINK